jgi:hypothetical protein
MEIRDITKVILQEINKRDARIYELELALSRIHANAAESPEWIRHLIKKSVPNLEDGK